MTKTLNTFTLPVAALAKAMRVITPALGGARGPVIVSHVLIQASKGKLSFLAANLETFIQASIPEYTEQVECSVAIQNEKLFKLSVSSPEKEITLSLEKDALSFKSGSFKGRIPGLPADDFPTEFMDVSSVQLVLPASELGSALSRASKFCQAYGNDIFSAVHVCSRSGMMLIEASDRRILFSHDTEWPFDGKILFPQKQAAALGGLLLATPENTEVQFSYGERSLQARVDGQFIYQSLLMEGHFSTSEYYRPKPSERRVECATAPLLAALQRVTSMSDDEIVPVVGKLSDGGEELSLLVGDDAVKSFRETVSVISSGVGGLSFRCNAKYLITALKNMQGESVVIDQADNLSAINLIGKVEFCVIMPLRVVDPNEEQ